MGIGESRVKKMKVRDELLHLLLNEAASKCCMVSRGQNYPHLLQKLIVQGLIKIDEMTITIYRRLEDISIVKKILPDAVSEYVEIIERESGIKLNPTVEINTDRSKDLPEYTHGGVMLTAIDGKMVCDNTMALDSSLYMMNFFLLF